MATVIEAIYRADEGILKLERKLDLLDQTRVKVTIEPLPELQPLARRLSGTIVIGEESARRIVEHEDLTGVE